MGPRTVTAALLLAALAGCSTGDATPAATPEVEAPVAVEAPAPLDAAGLQAAIATPEMVSVVTYDATTDPNQLLGRPGGYASRVSWDDTRVPAEELAAAEPGDAERGGVIECFADEAAAAERLAYLGAFVGTLLNEYQTVHGPCVLRLTGALLPDQAAAIAAAVDVA